MREAVALVAAALLASGCASAPPPEKQPFPGFEPGRGAAAREPAGSAGPAGASQAGAPADAPDLASMDPAAVVKRNPRPEFCEEAARRVQRTSRDKAWSVLKACVATGKFTLLARLVEEAWAEDLRTRSDASVLLAKVVAARGGDVGGDLGVMRQKRIPLFALGPAMSHPDLYKGRLVLFRAEVRDVKLAGAKATAQLAEFGIGVSERYVQGSSRYVTRGSSSYGNSTGYSSRGDAAYGSSLERLHTKNVPVETGLHAVAKLAQVDPFFEPGRQFVVLGRFDGVREEEGEELDSVTKTAVISIIAYYEPSANIVE
jgi:hypothetical protein